MSSLSPSLHARGVSRASRVLGWAAAVLAAGAALTLLPVKWLAVGLLAGQSGKPSARGAAIASPLVWGATALAGLALAVALTRGPMQDLALRAFLVYGAVILSFLGGIRWGAAARAAQGGVSWNS